MIKQSRIDRIMKKVVYDHGCWTYVGFRTASGYGMHGGTQNGHCQYVHRILYESENGPIPDGLEIDHLCRNRACCNPAHLEAVTHQENKRRAIRTHCKYGHPISEKGNRRRCVECQRRGNSKLSARRKMERHARREKGV